MKKLFVLLLAAAVAVGASAGVNNKLINKETAKVNLKKNVERVQVKKGGATAFNTIALNAFDVNARPTNNHAIKDGDCLVWDFEDEAQLNDWVVLDEDGDGYTWEYTTGDGIKAHSGYGVVASASYDNNFGVLYPDNWLVSAWLPLHGKLGFYACGQDPSWAGEVFAVYIYTDSNPEWVKISDDITATGVMTPYEFDLSEYEGSEGTIAIVHHNVSDMFRLNVDDIHIGDFEFEPEPEPEVKVITEIPEGLEVNNYWRTSGVITMGWGVSAGYTDGTFAIAIDPETNDAYVQNPAWNYDGNDTWVKGTFDPETGIITIPTGQYLSWSDAYGYGIVLGWGSTYVYEDTDESGELGYYLGFEIDDRTTEIQMMIDGNNVYLLGTNGDLEAEFPEWGFAEGMLTFWSDDLSMTSIEFAKGEEPFGMLKTPAVPAVPAMATATEWYDCGDESGFSRFYFTLPTTDVDGNILDPEFISYALWINDGFGNTYQFTFPAEDYSFDLIEDIDEVPYDLYTSAVDFNSTYVYMYRTNEGDNPLFVRDEEHNGNIGIKVFYTVDGVRNASEDIAWLYEVPSSVNEMNAGKTVANVRYFNVAGQEMAQPSGMTIKVTTYTDGTTSAVKVVK